MFAKNLNTKKQGDAGLGVAVGWFAATGYTVAIPLTDSQPYDLIVDRDGRLRRVQVKTTTYRPKGAFAVSLTVKGGNRSGTGKIKKLDPSTVDDVFVLTGDGKMYLIPVEHVGQYFTLSSRFDVFEVHWGKE